MDCNATRAEAVRNALKCRLSRSMIATLELKAVTEQESASWRVPHSLNRHSLDPSLTADTTFKRLTFVRGWNRVPDLQ
jgi:hypothetical protein